ncbi:MAG: hypothetical protein INR65_00970 [Gluconacetobacter diazotrophicus]|nr:hypothetical protein [Gluconacetobacter diazotrophicus]
MFLRCPSCATEYDVPERCRGRRTRCARCGTEWRIAAAAAPEPAADTAAGEGNGERVGEAAIGTPEPERVGGGGRNEDTGPGEAAVPAAPPAAIGAARARPGPVLLAACWMLSLAATGGAGFGFVHWQNGIARHWPPSQRVYALMQSIRFG